MPPPGRAPRSSQNRGPDNLTQPQLLLLLREWATKTSCLRKVGLACKSCMLNLHGPRDNPHPSEQQLPIWRPGLPPAHSLPLPHVTMASGSWGCGATLMVPGDYHLTIAEKELLPIILACATWGRAWQGHRVGVTTRWSLQSQGRGTFCVA